MSVNTVSPGGRSLIVKAARNKHKLDSFVSLFLSIADQKPKTDLGVIIKAECNPAERTVFVTHVRAT